MVSWRISRHLLNRKLNNDMQLRFLRRMARLLDNGYSLIRSLEIIAWDDQLAAIAEKLTEDLKTGYSLDEALSMKKFDPTITAYLAVSKVNGDMQRNIEKCVAMFEERLEQVNKLKQTIRYPSVLLVI